MQTFFDGCAAAGPEACAFHAARPENISQRLDNLLESIKRKPIPIFSPSGYGILDYAALRDLIFQALYRPYDLFPSLAQFLADTEAGRSSDLGLNTLPPRLSSRNDPSCPPETSYPNTEAGTSIMCMDGAIVQDSLEDLKVYHAKLAKQSSFADMWSRIHIGCR